MYGFRPTMTRAQIAGYIVGLIFVCVHMLSVCTQGYTSSMSSRGIIQQALGLIVNDTQDCTFGPYRSLEGGSTTAEESLEQVLLEEGLSQETSVDIPHLSEIMVCLSYSLFALAELLVTKRSEVLIGEVIHPDRKANDFLIVYNHEQDPDFITHLIDEFTLTESRFSSWS